MSQIKACTFERQPGAKKNRRTGEHVVHYIGMGCPARCDYFNGKAHEVPTGICLFPEKVIEG